MPYDSLVSRTDTGALVPEDVSRDMLGRVTRETSATLQLFRRVPVAGIRTRFPILTALPISYWVTGDTGLKQTTEAAWGNKYLDIEEIACIVPIPESVAEDLESAGVDVWDEIRPDVEEAIGRTLDTAVFFGVNAPAVFPTNVSAAAAAAGNTTTEDATVQQGGIQDDIDEALGLVEADGFDPSGVVAALSLKGRLRRARDNNGQRLAGVNGDLTEYEGLRIAYPMRGLFPSGGAAGTNVRAIVGDFSDFVAGVRRDVSFKLLTEAVIQDGAGAIVYNLAQQDLIAARFTFRAGWQVSNRLNRDQPTETSRYPAARLMF
ncbi:MAG: phage major capsid protein [Chloroflexi bacterium]|nr:phage major capsid protein [Chloroflexota bacterium]